MLNWSYNFTLKLLEHLKKTEDFRRKLLLTPLNPRVEIQLQWEALIKKLYYSASLTGSDIAKSKIPKTLARVEKGKKLSKEEKEVADFKNALDKIRYEWLINPQPITLEIIFNLQKALLGESVTFRQGAKEIRDAFTNQKVYQAPPSWEIERSLHSLLEFLNLPLKERESPAIPAGIAQIQIIRILPFENGNDRLSRLLSLLILYKHGYELRHLLVLEEFFRKDLKGYHQAIKKSLEGNLTFWLEYFSLGITDQLEKIIELLPSPEFLLRLPELNERQQWILGFLERPRATIANKTVQKRFRVSQVTASRDLSKLKSWGLLLRHGKGRSAYYTRA